MRWFEPNLQKLLTEAGTNGLRISDIVRNICNMEPQLFGERHPCGRVLLAHIKKMLTLPRMKKIFI